MKPLVKLVSLTLTSILATSLFASSFTLATAKTSTKTSNDKVSKSSALKQTIVNKPSTKKIDAILGFASIVVNGNKIAIKDVNKNNVEPVIYYNGTTYIPLRALSTALATNIEWDAKDHVIYVGKKLQEDMVSIDKLTPSENTLFKNNGWKNSFFLINGEKYVVNSSLTSYYKGSATYLLNKKYTELVGQFSIDDSTNADKTAILNIYADDSKLPIFSHSSKFGDKNNPINIDVDITGVNKLKIELAGDSCYKDFWNIYLRSDS